MESAQIQTRVVEELYLAHWEGEADITSHEDLALADIEAGLDKVEVEDWLATRKGEGKLMIKAIENNGELEIWSSCLSQ
ncbi:hypothetical protein PVAG01_10151 [Phlyctema vagabunda]|uniref:Uncharacterized protein n=1 Tax=Phlyctema vagabunda TaxID=108571 RepID=A0ABR4P563_9HELO